MADVIKPDVKTSDTQVVYRVLSQVGEHEEGAEVTFPPEVDIQRLLDLKAIEPK